MSILRSISVVIPARNEERLIGRCLTAVVDAVQYARRELTPHALTVEIIVVADGCNDATAQLARDAGATVISLDARNVGKARAAGADLALRRGVGPHAERWIANTDADSVVPRNWLLEQIAIARRGYDVMIGTVRPEFADLTPEQCELWLKTHTPGFPNGHVHGANLGVRADVYLAAGGFAPLAESEDNDLVGRLAGSGARLLAADSCEVLTSGRRFGRTPGGYAGYLRDQLIAMQMAIGS